jgi:O-antigen/teichoic acid export membrane protein
MLNRTSLKFNFFFNVIGAVLPVAIALVTVPIYISHIGTARYGVLSIAWLILGYFGFLDFGLSRAAANALAKLAHSSKEERARVLMTSLYFNLAIGTFGGIVFYFAGGMLLPALLTGSESVRGEVEAALPWIACMLPLAMLAGVGRGAIQSRESFLALNVLDLIGFSLGQLLPILFIITKGPSLTVVIPAALLARALSVGLNLGWVARTEGVSQLLVFDRSRFKELFRFGAWVTVTNIIGPLLHSADQLLVGSVLGATAVAHYSVPMNLVSRSQVLSTSLSSVLFPRFSRLNPEEAMLLAKKAVVSLGYGYGAICGPAIVIGSTFLKLWIGTDFASHAAVVLELLLVGAWFNGIAYIPYALLQGQGRPDLVAKLHTLESLPYIALLWFLLNQFGLPGAALAWSARVIADAVCLFGLSRFPLRQLLRLIPALLLILTSYFAAQMIGLSTLEDLLLAGAIFVAFAGFALAFDGTARQMLAVFRVRLAGAGS